MSDNKEKRIVEIPVGDKNYRVLCGTRMLLQLEKKLRRPVLEVLSKWQEVDEENIAVISATDVLTVIQVALQYGETKPKAKELEAAFDEEGVLGYFLHATRVLSTVITGDAPTDDDLGLGGDDEGNSDEDAEDSTASLV